MLPTAHGFDEFFGNLYHLNAEEEPENPDYPKNPEFKKKFGPRGVIHSFAGGKITDTGPLTRKRMETIDEEVTVKALDFMQRAQGANKPFFLWWNSTRMHVFTHLKKESEGKTGLGIYADGMVEHDGHVGQVLAKLEGARHRREHDRHVLHRQRRRDVHLARRRHDDVPRREEHELGGRLPRALDASAGRASSSRARSSTTSCAHEDMLPTLLAAAGDTTAKEDLLKGRDDRRHDLQGPPRRLRPRPRAQGRGAVAAPRVHLLDRRRQRRGAALRQLEDHVPRAEGHGLQVWQEPFVELRAPLITNLRMDPFERAEDENAMGYQRWYMDRMFLIAPAGAYVGQWLQSFRDFPPRQKPGSFNLDRVMEAVSKPIKN